MHPHLLSSAWRLALVALACLALTTAACWSITDVLDRAGALEPQIADIEPVSLPGPDARPLLLEAAEWTSARPSEAAVKKVEQSLLGHQGAGREQTRLGMILRDGDASMAMIDGRIVRPGEILPDGRIVQDITAHGVVLLTADKAELVVWSPPLEVRLEKPAEASPRAKPEDRPPDSSLEADLDRLAKKSGQVVHFLRRLGGSNTPD